MILSKRKFNVFLDIVTVLLVLFPLLMAVGTAIFNGSFEFTDVGSYVEQFSISNALTDKIMSSVDNFGFDFDGAFARASFVIMSNALIIYLFRVFVAVMVFIPKMAYRFINFDFGGKY